MKLKKKYRKKVLFVGILLALLFFIPKAFAEDIVPVTPGTGTLQQQINSAVEGATLQLSEGTYKGDITIDKNITIQGVSNQSIIDGKIIIKSEDHQGNLNVTLKNYRIPPSSLSSSDLVIFNTYKYIDVQSPTNLTLSNVIINPVISRPPVGYRAGGPIALNIAETADHSTIEVQDHTELTCHYDGIHIFASQVTLNVTDSSVSGALALNLENGSDNKVTFRNSSLV